MYAQVEKSKESKSQSVANEVSQKPSGVESAFQFVDNRPEAIAQRKLQVMANDSPQVSQLRAFQDMANNDSAQLPVPIQMVERQTTIYAKQGQNWNKNMQIIDSNSPSDYVHLSRSTNTDPQQFRNQVSQHPQGFNVDGSRGTTEEIADDENPQFDRDLFTAENNVHITLEGRYMTVMRTLATDMFDNRVAIKNGPPVGAFANLNFGDFNEHGEQQVSNYAIQQWIEMAADDTEYFLRTGIEEEYEGQANDLIDVLEEVKNSTLDFTEQLIATTPALNNLEENDNLVHYGGAPWATS